MHHILSDLHVLRNHYKDTFAGHGMEIIPSELDDLLLHHEHPRERRNVLMHILYLYCVGGDIFQQDRFAQTLERTVDSLYQKDVPPSPVVLHPPLALEASLASDEFLPKAC